MVSSCITNEHFTFVLLSIALPEQVYVYVYFMANTLLYIFNEPFIQISHERVSNFNDSINIITIGVIIYFAQGNI